MGNVKLVTKNAVVQLSLSKEIKYPCKECGNSSICEHGHEKAHYKECGGSACCQHGKLKKNVVKNVLVQEYVGIIVKN